MPLFACAKCDVVENTALCDYWVQQKDYYEANGTMDGFEGVCSECKTGQWHGEFEKRTADQTAYIENDQGFLVEDPRDAEYKAMFKELIESCSPGEQKRILEGIRDGYFQPSKEPRKKQNE